MDDFLLELKNVRMHFPVTRGFFKRVVGQVKAVDGVSFAIKAGETFSLVGESGCGKTTLGNLIVRALRPTGGEILFRHNDHAVDLAGLSEQELNAQGIRRAMQMIFQDPYSSLNPRMRVVDVIGEPLIVNRIAKGKALEERVKQLLRQVGLQPHYLKRYPHAFSGGQRQRIGLARALALNPSLIVADEPVSALDVSIQAQILNLLQDLQEAFQLTYLFISHDLSVVEHISDRVAVMYVGKIVELAETELLFRQPKHPYTEALLSAVPRSDPEVIKERIILTGEVADPANPPSGCSFHPRCPYQIERCVEEEPVLQEIAPGRFVSCHRTEELQLAGVQDPVSNNPAMSYGAMA
jgi:peptide/nickel transport system ATP-binding protein